MDTSLQTVRPARTQRRISWIGAGALAFALSLFGGLPAEAHLDWQKESGVVTLDPATAVGPGGGTPPSLRSFWGASPTRSTRRRPTPETATWRC